ncbi:MAG TPA: MFS transporter, partial [Arthrobacter sp.]|nr:MFS transporter [Arthrobacter sp.]
MSQPTSTGVASATKPAVADAAAPRPLNAVERSNARRAVIAASIGNGLEWFDLIVYGTFAVTISKLFFPTTSDAASLLLTFAS